VIEPASTPGVHVWWLGQSGFLIGHEGRHLLVDPYLSDSLTAKYEGTATPHVRMHPRVVAPEELAFADAVLSTHGHTDHLDRETLRAIGAPVVAPARIVELARERSGGDVMPISEGETVEIAGFRVRAVPAEHPGEHCVGYAIEAGGRSLYHSGDTTWIDPGVRGVDVAFLPINGKLGNLDGREAARLARTVEAALAVPCHFDMFEFNTATPDLFVAECERLGQRYRVLALGERLTLDRGT
jgi:L-ascorbate metabolism protein UlaG (beta-lactamase superfamily)